VSDTRARLFQLLPPLDPPGDLGKYAHAVVRAHQRLNSRANIRKSLRNFTLTARKLHFLASLSEVIE
jgi:hypothetical protein